MKISAKTRYAIAAIVHMAQTYEAKTCIPLVILSENLGISKIFLEQVFSLLKRAGIVKAVKGAQGGYLLACSPQEISVFDVMFAVDPSLFAKTSETVVESAPHIEKAIQNKIFDRLDENVKALLSSINFSALAIEAQKDNGSYMYYL